MSILCDVLWTHRSPRETEINASRLQDCKEWDDMSARRCKERSHECNRLLLDSNRLNQGEGDNEKATRITSWNGRYGPIVITER